MRAIVIDTQGQAVPGGVSGMWWCDRRLAQLEANAMRARLLIELARQQ